MPDFLDYCFTVRVVSWAEKKKPPCKAVFSKVQKVGELTEPR